MVVNPFAILAAANTDTSPAELLGIVAAYAAVPVVFVGSSTT